MAKAASPDSTATIHPSSNHALKRCSRPHDRELRVFSGLSGYRDRPYLSRNVYRRIRLQITRTLPKSILFTHLGRISVVPLSVLASNQFQEDMRRLAELKPLLPVVLLAPSKAVSPRWGNASGNSGYIP